MAEQLTTYELREKDVAVPMDRDEFYDNQVKVISATGKADKAAEMIALLLFNRDGEIILQKRSHNKRHNPYLIDKAIGGHVKFGDSPRYTVMVETVQELRVPSIVLRTNEDFAKTFALLDSYLDNVAIVKEVDKDFMELERNIDGKAHNFTYKVHLYIGVYGGATKPVDKEASGVLYYDLDILQKEIAVNPSAFTKDISYFLSKYEKEIQTFLQHFK